MCILFIRTNSSPKEGEFRLIIAANRDEFYSRPAKEAFLCPVTKIIGGRDMEKNRENGMWLGMKIKENDQKKLCFSAILNVTGAETESGAQGRGFIIPNYLNSSQTSIEYFKKLIESQKFNAFNLVNVELSVNDGVCTYFQSNAPQQICKFPGEQILAFGNSPVNRPLTKVRNGRFQFEKITQNYENKEELMSGLIKFLKSSEKNLPDPELEKRIPEYLEGRSSIFVEIEGIYGTRTHTIILVDKNWNVEFHEETMEYPIDAMNVKWKKNIIKANL